jgi:hypothetical protein
MQVRLRSANVNYFDKDVEANVLERVVGWSPNERCVVGKNTFSYLYTVLWYRGKAAPRVANLSALLDSTRLIHQSMDLNLRLMKWRLWPTLNTEVIANSKCLLLGAGTLGCAVLSKNIS